MTRRHRLHPILALALCASLGIGSAQGGEITRHGFESSLLGREYHYTLYLPDGYEGGRGRYPVLYLLHGASGDENVWPERVDVRATVDRLVEGGEIPPLVVVMPGHNLSWWVDGNHEPASTALRQELVPHIDATLRTIPGRKGRLVGGLSAGGFGAVNLALDHPEMFSAAAGFSPAVYAPLPPETSGARNTPQFAVDGVFDPETWRGLNHEPRLKRYMTRDKVVPFYLMSGDHDALGIALYATLLFEQLRDHQPDLVELRIVDGGHDSSVWRSALPDALRYLCRFVDTER